MVFFPKDSESTFYDYALQLLTSERNDLDDRHYFLDLNKFSS
jgi:hypothetical protein